MTTFAFTATVTNLDLNDADQLDALFTDEFVIVPSAIDGVTSIDVEIDAESGEDALEIFLAHMATTEVKIERVLEDLVNVPEIAARLGVSRETVRTWVAGTRGAADFPAHRMVVGNQKLWTWCAVYAWAVSRARLSSDEPTPLDATCVDWINGQLAPKPIEAEPTTFILFTAGWANSTWSSQVRRRVTAPMTPRVSPHYEARDGAHWSYTEGHMEKVGA